MKFPSVKRVFLPLVVHMFEVGQDFATVHTPIVEEYEKGIPTMSNAIQKMWFFKSYINSPAAASLFANSLLSTAELMSKNTSSSSLSASNYFKKMKRFAIRHCLLLG